MKWRQRLIGLGTTATLLSILALVIAGPGHRFGIMPVKLAVLGSALAAVIALIALLLLVVALVLPKGKTPIGKHLIMLVIAGAITAQMGMAIAAGAKVPQIHDISTDTSNPPQFDLLAGARAGAANPLAYAGPEVAALQAEAYPNVQPLLVDAPVASVLEAAAAVAGAEGWSVVQRADAMQIEATVTSFWFGFKDDVIIRAQAQGDQTRVDIRSKSRVGKSDLGANAARIELLLNKIPARLAAGS
ncbi:MAG: DUF1499 domain-containing protein [Pseudomonadota bacterium]